MNTDTEAVRAALWARTSDDYAEARAEGIRGLAQRRDRRVITMLAELLDDEDGAHVHTFHAAQVLGAPELLPHLLKYDPADYGVAEAIRACDPAISAITPPSQGRVGPEVQAPPPHTMATGEQVNQNTDSV